MATMKMAQKAKKRRVWTKMATPLVRMLWNYGTPRPLPGIWQSSPGVRSTKKSVAISTGPQSAILLFFFNSAGRLPSL
jgi:hypothetical protein